MSITRRDWMKGATAAVAASGTMVAWRPDALAQQAAIVQGCVAMGQHRGPVGLAIDRQ